MSPRHSLPFSVTGHVGSGSQTKPAAGTAQGFATGQRETNPPTKIHKSHWSSSDQPHAV